MRLRFDDRIEKSTVGLKANSQIQLQMIGYAIEKNACIENNHKTFIAMCKNRAECVATNAAF